MKTADPKEQQTLDAARHFATMQVKPRAVAWDRGQADTRHALAEAAHAGLLGLQVPVPHGGQGLSFACKCSVAEILAAADFGLAMSVINTHNVANLLARRAAPDVVRRFVPALLSGQRTGCTALTEPGAGSDFSAITTFAQALDGEW